MVKERRIPIKSYPLSFFITIIVLSIAVFFGAFVCFLAGIHYLYRLLKKFIGLFKFDKDEDYSEVLKYVDNDEVM